MRSKSSKSVQKTAKQPIGVFDSGLGGLTVVREIRRQLPNESIIYFGDIARLPYGIKSKEQILSFSIQNTLFLLKKKVKSVVVACNSSASAAYHFLKNHFNLPVVDVIQPAAEEAIRCTSKGRIGVIATQATIQSGSYEKALKKLNPKSKIVSVACPLFVSLVEEGWLRHSITDQVIDQYLRPLKKQNMDTLILGCTHYPLLKKSIQQYMGSKIQIIDSAHPTVLKLTSLLHRNELNYPVNGKATGRGELKIFVSDMPRNFRKIGEQFLGEKLKSLEIVREK